MFTKYSALEVSYAFFLIVREADFVAEKRPHSVGGGYAIVSAGKHLCRVCTDRSFVNLRAIEKQDGKRFTIIHPTSLLVSPHE